MVAGPPVIQPFKTESLMMDQLIDTLNSEQCNLVVLHDGRVNTFDGVGVRSLYHLQHDEPEMLYHSKLAAKAVGRTAAKVMAQCDVDEVYADVISDYAYDTNAYTREEVVRILKVAYQYAQQRRKHLTVVDKANVLASSRLWRAVAQEMAPQYPDVTTDYMYVDNASMRMIQEPTFFDVMVTENTFGDILTDEGSCITGSMGLLPSASTGEHTPVFEPIHGSWPQAKGLNIANPLAQILSVAMLYEYFGLKEEGELIRQAVNASLDQNVRTPEIQVEGGKKYGTKEVGEWIVDYIKKA